jgi:hypothetical protein
LTRLPLEPKCLHSVGDSLQSVTAAGGIMSAQHIAGLPIEELLLAAIATATPLIALITWEIRDRLRRLRKLGGRGS